MRGRRVREGATVFVLFVCELAEEQINKKINHLLAFGLFFESFDFGSFVWMFRFE